MFKRVLLCYDGSDTSRRVLKTGVELASLMSAQVFVLSIVPAVIGTVSAAHAADYYGSTDFEFGYRQLLDESIAWLRSRGIEAEGHLARGNAIDQIIAYAQQMSADLIVVGHYPQAKNGRWWSGAQRASLAERSQCSVLIAVADSSTAATTASQ
jgi:nucleotide-binding universal stress UspA family protein